MCWASRHPMECPITLRLARAGGHLNRDREVFDIGGGPGRSRSPSVVGCPVGDPGIAIRECVHAFCRCRRWGAEIPQCDLPGSPDVGDDSATRGLGSRDGPGPEEPAETDRRRWLAHKGNGRRPVEIGLHPDLTTSQAPIHHEPSHQSEHDLHSGRDASTVAIANIGLPTTSLDRRRAGRRFPDDTAKATVLQIF